MAKLIYITNASLDGYIEDQTGAFDWGSFGTGAIHLHYRMRGATP